MSAVVSVPVASPRALSPSSPRGQLTGGVLPAAGPFLPIPRVLTSRARIAGGGVLLPAVTGSYSEAC